MPPRALEPSGLFLVDKPAGPSSFQVIAAIRRRTRARTGHAGTLDPFATGLLLVLSGAATRLAPWLVGLEADWQWASQKSNSTNCTPPAATVAFFGAGANGFGYCVATEQKITNFGTARARGGAIVNDSLWYVTGGAAWGTVKDTYVAQGSANPTIFRGALQPGPFLAGGGTFSHTRTGWTVGGGVETKLFRGWTAKLEYLHVDLGGRTETFAVPINAAFGAAFNTGGSAGVTTRTKVTDNVIRVGLNYKIF